jgi:hypothetical protein
VRTANTQAFTHAPAGSPAQDYFSFDCGDMHVLVLDTQSPLTSGSAQYDFADGDLAASTRTWKVVKFHMPAYTLKSVKLYCWATGDVNPTSFTLSVFNEKGIPLDTLILNKPNVLELPK